MPRLLLALLTLATSLFISAHAADIDTLERELAKAREAAPMVVTPFMAVTREAQYFGDYEPRPNTVYNRGEKLNVKFVVRDLNSKKSAAVDTEVTLK